MDIGKTERVIEIELPREAPAPTPEKNEPVPA